MEKKYTKGEFRLTVNLTEFLAVFSEMASRNNWSEFKICSLFSHLTPPSVSLLSLLKHFPFLFYIARMDRKFSVKVAKIFFNSNK